MGVLIIIFLDYSFRRGVVKVTGESRLLSFLGLRRGDGRSLQSVFYVYLLAFDLLKLPSGRKFALKLQTKNGRVSATPATSSMTPA